MNKKAELIFYIFVILACAVNLFAIYSLKGQLEDCRFECNHLQTKLQRLEEFNDYISAMEQLLPPLVLAQLKVATLMIKNEKYKAYEGTEQPLLTKKEKK